MDNDNEDDKDNKDNKNNNKNNGISAPWIDSKGHLIIKLKDR